MLFGRRLRSFQSEDEQREPHERGRDPPVSRERRPPLHPSKRSWTFDEDPVPMINPVPTAKSFKSEDSSNHLQEIETRHSRYSIEQEEEDEEEEEEDQAQQEDPPEERQILEDKDDAAKEDKYLEGAHRISLWSDDSDSMLARWKSLSGDASPAKSARNLLSPIARLSPRWLQREPSPRAPIRNTSLRTSRRYDKGLHSSRQTESREPVYTENQEERQDVQSTTVISERTNSSGSRLRKERAPKPEDVLSRGRRGRQKSSEHRSDNERASTDETTIEPRRKEFEENSDRSKNTKSSKISKRSGSSKMSSSETAAVAEKSKTALSVDLPGQLRSKRSDTMHRDADDQSNFSRSALRKQRSEISKAGAATTSRSRSDLEGENDNFGTDHSNALKAGHAALTSSVLNNLTSFQSSERPSSNGGRNIQKSKEQRSRYAPAESNPTQDALTDLRASEAVNMSNEQLPPFQQEQKDNFNSSLLQRDILILNDNDLPSKYRDPPENDPLVVETDHDEKRYDPPTGKSWTSTDVASSLTGSLPVTQLPFTGREKEAYAAYLALHNRTEPVASQGQGLSGPLPLGMNRPFNDVRPMETLPAIGRDHSFPKQRVRSGVIYPPSMKGMDPPSAAVPDDYPVAFTTSRPAIVRAEPVASRPLVDRDDAEEAGEYSFRQSLIELCEPVACFLLDGIRAVRNIDNGACDEPFTFLDCKTLECENETSTNEKSIAVNHESNLQVLEAKSMKLDEESQVELQGDQPREEQATRDLKPIHIPELVPAYDDAINDGCLPVAMIEIPTPKPLGVDDDSYNQSILGLVKASQNDRMKPPTPPRGHKSKRHSIQRSTKERPHKRSNSKDFVRTRSTSEERQKRSLTMSNERARIASPRPVVVRTKKRGFFGKLFRKGR